MSRARLAVLALALAAAATASSAWGKPKPVPTWATIDARIDVADSGQLYRDVFYAANPHLSAEQVADQDKLFENPEYLWGVQPNGDYEVEDGPLAGHWHFVNRADHRWPVAAFRLVPRPIAPYSASIDIYETSKDKLTQLQMAYDLGALKAPRPPKSLFSTLEASWSEIVFTEPCARGAYSISDPKYPSPELEKGDEGTVVVGVLFNSCGEVRDVRILTTSGHTNFDLMAAEAAYRSRVRPPNKSKGGKGRLTFEFKTDPEN
jgi:TonB family protein